MKTQYILIRKNKSEAKSVRIQSEVKTVIKEASFDVGNNVIYFSKDDEDKYVTYRMSYEDNNVLYLTIATELRGEAGARCLEEFNDRFIKGKHRSKFYIINAYSDASYYFCSKLMPKLASFERLLREFVYLTLTRVYGSEWVKIFDLQLREHIAEISKGKVSKNNEFIEESLEWLEFGEIEKVLFFPAVYEDSDAIVSEILSSENMTKNDILAKLKIIEKKSLWEREFQEFSDVKGLQENFNEFRNIRNTVMHNKTINLQYFEESILKIKKINKQLTKSIEKIEKDVYNRPKDRRTIVIDGRVFAEAVWKTIQPDDELKRKIELGQRMAEKLSKLFGSTNLSDLIDTQLLINDRIKKIGNK